MNDIIHDEQSSGIEPSFQIDKKPSFSLFIEMLNGVTGNNENKLSLNAVDFLHRFSIVQFKVLQLRRGEVQYHS